MVQASCSRAANGKSDLQVPEAENGGPEMASQESLVWILHTLSPENFFFKFFDDVREIA